MKGTNICIDCGADLLRVGRRHQCDKKLVVVIPSTTYEHRQAGKRRKYQRELMREIRAKRKALKAKQKGPQEPSDPRLARTDIETV